MKEPKDLKHEELVGLVSKIQEFMFLDCDENGWVWNLDKEVDADTLTNVTGAMDQYGLCPEGYRET